MVCCVRYLRDDQEMTPENLEAAALGVGVGLPPPLRRAPLDPLPGLALLPPPLALRPLVLGLARRGGGITNRR